MSDSPQPVILIPPSREKDPSADPALSLGFFAALRITAERVGRLPARVAGGLIWLYQRTLSPALVALNPTCGCRYAPTCSHNAREALREHGFLAGLVLTIIRLAKCGPWHPGGENPVPPSPRLRRTAPPLTCVAIRK
jgi:putative membrane protein insertion efficiency factor